MIICAREGCEVEFTPTKHNQKYHSNVCTKIATNKRVMEQYYDRQDQLKGKPRFCIKCSSRLSRYNDMRVCSSCQSKARTEANLSAAIMLTDVDLTA